MGMQDTEFILVLLCIHFILSIRTTINLLLPPFLVLTSPSMGHASVGLESKWPWTSCVPWASYSTSEPQFPYL